MFKATTKLHNVYDSIAQKIDFGILILKLKF